MHTDALADALEPFFADNLIRDILYQVKSGKEATLYCCRGGQKVGNRLVAAKVYKPRRDRTFRNDSVYREGRVILNQRDARAAAKRTDYGREVQSTLWTAHEFGTLRVLHRAGSDVPKPLASAAGALLMEWIGDGNGESAPQLKDVALEANEAQPLFDRLLANVELWLACNIVHADLSPYNLLYDRDRLVAIDFPQGSDPRFNANAYSLLARDLDHVCRFFARCGVEADTGALAADLWDRFMRGAL